MMMTLLLLLCDLIPGGDFASTAVIFLTDGSDTCSGGQHNVNRAMDSLKTKLQRLQHPISVHTIGFTAG
jgi:hypothetical protein